MTEIYLLRHGETDWNIVKRYQGVSDIPLNPNGQLQAKAAANKLVNQVRNITAIYSSPQKRAFQTAQAVSERLGLPIYQDDRLREINLGDWEGRLSTEIKQNDGERNWTWHHFPLAVNPPGEHGESVMQVVERVSAALDEIAEKHPQETVVVVTHGFTLAVAVCQALGVDLNHLFEYIPENAGLTRIEWTAKCSQPAVMESCPDDL